MQPDDEPQFSVEVMQAVRSGNKIAAIKILREERGLGLKDAKDAIDRLSWSERDNMQTPGGQESSERGRVFLFAVIVASAIAYAVYRFILTD